MSGAKPATKRRIRKFFQRGCVLRVARSTMRESGCCGSRCCSPTKSRSPMPLIRLLSAKIGSGPLEILRELCRIEWRGENRYAARLRIEQKDHGRMVHRVVASRKLYALVSDAEIGSHGRDR